MKRPKASDVCAEGHIITKRSCYRDLLRSIPNSMKRKREEELCPVIPEKSTLDKAFYSKLEVQILLEEAEVRNMQQLESYCTALGNLLIPQGKMTYVS